MEQPPKKILAPELQNLAHEGERQIKELEEELKDVIQLYEEGLEFIQDDIDYLEHMQRSNEGADLLNEDAEELGRQPLKKYSEEDMEKLLADIEKAKKSNEEINAVVAKLILRKVEVSRYIDRVHELDERFKKMVTNINPESLN